MYVLNYEIVSMSLPLFVLPAGRRVAELELHIAMAHIMRNFRVEYPESTPVGIKQMIVLTPDRPLNLTFMNL